MSAVIAFVVPTLKGFYVLGIAKFTFDVCFIRRWSLVSSRGRRIGMRHWIPIPRLLGWILRSMCTSGISGVSISLSGADV
jgi:hypothetical protein